jgi:hypothetical protein
MSSSPSPLSSISSTAGIDLIFDDSKQDDISTKGLDQINTTLATSTLAEITNSKSVGSTQEKLERTAMLIDDNLEASSSTQVMLESGEALEANASLADAILELEDGPITITNTEVTKINQMETKAFQSLITKITKKSNKPEVEKTLSVIQESLRGIIDLDAGVNTKQLIISEIISRRLGYVNFNHLDTSEMFIEIPVCDNDEGHFHMQNFRIEKIFQSKSNIPCWGLVPINELNENLNDPNIAPIVLWRGTVPSVSALGGLTSIFQNLDATGSGHTMFQRNKNKLTDWLKENTQNGAIKARTMGHSQGAALATYTAIELHQYMSTDYQKSPSAAWCVPGVNKAEWKKWKKIPSSEQPALISTLVSSKNVEDPVSKTGECIVSGLALSIKSGKDDLNQLEAHVRMMTTRSQGFLASVVNLSEDRKQFVRQLFRQTRGLRKALDPGQAFVNSIAMTSRKTSKLVRGTKDLLNNSKNLFSGKNKAKTP